MARRYTYYIDYDGSMSSIRRVRPETNPDDIDMEYHTFAAAKTDLVLYCMEMRDDWAGLLREARRLRASDTE